MIPIDGDVLLEVAPRFSGKLAQAQATIVADVGEVLQPVLEEYGIDTRLRMAHFIAKTCHESAGFRTTEEFADGTAYEGRKDLGNTQKGDGPRFKGRGLIQLTGRSNYREYGKALKLDLENNPTLAAEPRLSLRVACEYWKRRKINQDADRDDIIAVTKKINGGTNGLDDRRKLTAKAKAALAKIEGHQIAGVAAENNDTRPVLRRGSKGEAVAGLQRLLQQLGFAVAIDGDFGAGTETAVTRFQSEQGVTADGILGPETWDQIEKAAKRKAA
jgi:putative chitinase